jgi:hypothetical protein
MSDETKRLCLSDLRRATVGRERALFGHREDLRATEYALSLFVYAGNVAKLIRNAARGDKVNPDRVAAELARTLVALDLLAHRCDVDLAQATVETFNADTVKLEDRHVDGSGTVRLKLGPAPFLEPGIIEREPAADPVAPSRRCGLMADDNAERVASANELAEQFGRGPSRWFFRRYFALRHEHRLALAFGVLFGIPVAGGIGKIGWAALRWFLER